MTKVKTQRASRAVQAPEEQRDALEDFAALFEEGSSGAEFKLLGPDGRAREIPRAMIEFIGLGAPLLARGDSIDVVPIEAELSTQRAADMLNVSRQYFVRLVDAGVIPSRKTGSHRRVRLSDVRAYKAQRDRDRAASLDELAALTQEYGGYDKAESED